MSSYIFKNYYFGEQIRKILSDRGIGELKNGDNDKLYYCDINYGARNNPRYSKCSIINQIENVNNLGNKSTQYNNFIKHFGEKKYYIPFTISFKNNNKSDIFKYFLGPKKRYILKPENSLSRFGVKVVDNYSDLSEQVLKSKYKDWILQEYMENPLLMEGKKFHFRVYVIYVGTEEYSAVYLIKNGFIYLAKMIYNPLSNDDEYNLSGESNENCVREFPGDFSKHFGINKWNKEVLPQIIKIVKETILSTIDKLKCPNRGVKNFKCFKLLGYDILINKNFKCFLAEINARDISFKYPSKKFMKNFYNNVLQIILDDNSLSTNQLLLKNIPAIRLLYIKGNVIIENLENNKKNENKKKDIEEKEIDSKDVPNILEENEKIIEETIREVKKEKPEIEKKINKDKNFVELSPRNQEKKIEDTKKSIDIVEKKLKKKKKKIKEIIKENRNLHYGAIIILIIAFLLIVNRVIRN